MITIMRSNLVKKIARKSAAAVLAAALVMSGAIFGTAGLGEVKAAAGDFVTEQFSEISTYCGDTRVAPKPATEENKDYIFAGWFTDEACTTVCTESSGSAYAKFVSPQVMNVAFQVTNNTTADTEKTALRLVSTVEGLKYQSVGFKVSNGTITKKISSTKVYSTINSTSDGLTYKSTPSVFDSAAVYFTTAKITNIPKASFDAGLTITTYWVTLDGTEVDGITRYVRVSDSYNSIVNVPVRLYTDAEIAAGYAAVTIPDGVSYVGCDSGILAEMEAAESDGKLKVVANVADITSNVKADGLFVNLRFKLTNSSSKPADDSFAVDTDTVQFCDKDEALKTVLAESMYNDFK